MKLLAGEQVLAECRHHWSVFLLPFILIGMTVYFYRMQSLLELFSFIFGLLAIAAYLFAVKRFLFHRYTLTNQRLIIGKGFGNNTDIFLHNIEGMQVRAIPLQKFVGNLTILCSGGTKYQCNTLKAPHQLREKLISIK